MEDIEILENITFDIPEAVEFEVSKKQFATMIINGVAQNAQEIEVISMVCPHCKNVLMTFDAGIPLVEVYKAFAELDTSRFVPYCPSCRTKLSYDKRIVSEQEGVFVE